MYTSHRGKQRSQNKGKLNTFNNICMENQSTQCLTFLTYNFFISLSLQLQCYESVSKDGATAD